MTAFSALHIESVFMVPINICQLNWSIAFVEKFLVGKITGLLATLSSGIKPNKNVKKKSQFQ